MTHGGPALPKEDPELANFQGFSNFFQNLYYYIMKQGYLHQFKKKKIQYLICLE